MSGLNPKRNRNRTAILAILALILVSAFLFYGRYPMSIAPALKNLRRADIQSTEQVVLAVDTPRNSPSSRMKKHKSIYAGQPQITLNPSQELAAISSFIASLPQNVIPPSVDPSKPIDPQLVLDFDTRSPNAMEEVDRVVDYVWTQNPVVLYCKFYSPASRELKAMLTEMNLRPPPFFVDVDKRDDVEVLMPILTRLTDSTELPIFLIGGKPVGSMTQIREMKASGELQRLIATSGAVIGGGKRRKHRK